MAAHFAPAQRPPPETSDGNSCDGVSPVGRAGDLDGDGIDDFVVTGAPLEPIDGVWYPGGEGVHVFYGRAQRFSVTWLSPARMPCFISLPARSRSVT